MKLYIFLYISYWYCNYVNGDFTTTQPSIEPAATSPQLSAQPDEKTNVDIPSVSQPTATLVEESIAQIATEPVTKAIIPLAEPITLSSIEVHNLIHENDENKESNNELNTVPSTLVDAQRVTCNTTYKLSYFEIRGRVEAIRLLLHYAGVEFEDFHIPRDEWIPKYKNNTPYGHVPILEECNTGRILAESFAILRYLAYKYNLATGIPQNESANELLWAAAKVDEFADFHKDVEQDFHSLFFPKFKTDLNTVAAGDLAKKYFGIYERQLKNNADTSGLLFPQLTWADLLIADFFETIRYLYPTVFESYPEIVKYHGTVHSLPQLQEYLQKRIPSV